MASLASSDIGIATDLITDIWILSKKPDQIQPHLLEMLNSSLRRILPDQDKYPNPIDFVIPTWETLWRVVAVTLAHVHTDTQACRAFQDLFDNPDKAQFRAPRLGGLFPSVEDHINESLRLYPPVKHISRHVFRQSLLGSFLPASLAAYIPQRFDMAVADIESAQRSPLWVPAPDPEIYDPARFLRQPSQARDILAFGYGPLRCVAVHWAPMAAATIVAVILNQVDGRDLYIVRGDRIGGRVGWDGWSVQRVNPDT
ncbi:hypothetical protein B0H10DRAFT_2020802 [Mycena sp. CBHHK59/15]|nr:hypothetical protein B0H10DRAFT_2020802 [Mycena sp. CBHHK59/15]